MQRVLSTYLFSNHALSSRLLEDVARARIPAVEVWCIRNHFDYRSPGAVRELAGWLEHNQLRLHALHSPTNRDIAPGRESLAPISIADTERVRRLDAVDEIKRALDVAESVPFQFLVQHMGSGREPLEPRCLDAAFNSLEHLAIFAKQRGVTIALENTPDELGTPSALCQFIQETRLQDLRLCFDTGHAHLEEGIGSSFATMRELVVTTHVHDNHGEKDEHLLPYEGSIDWDAALKALGSAPHQLPIVFELNPPTGSAAPIPLERVTATFDRMENALTATRTSAGGAKAQ